MEVILVGETILLVKLISGTEGSNKVLKQKMALVLMFALLSAIMLYSQKTKETLEIIVFNCSRGNLFLQFKYLQLQSLILNSTSSVTLLANMLNNLTWLYHPRGCSHITSAAGGGGGGMENADHC